MKSLKRYITVAVAGPIKRSFTYHLSSDQELLQPGQRLLVPFGKSKKIGYFIKEASKPNNIKTRQILKILDNSTYFSPELFELCNWVSDYYFSNPADTLSAALPSILKAHRGIELRWADNIENNALLAGLEKLVKPGKKLTPKARQEIELLGKGFLKKLLESNILTESFIQNISDQKKSVGYKVDDVTKWGSFFKKRTPILEPFNETMLKKQLIENGWTDYTLRKAVEKKLLKKIKVTSNDSILDFIKPTDDVSLLQLTSPQKEIVDDISDNLNNGFKPFLLHGITGSGKTLIYCHLVEKVIRKNKSVLVLTPEISLSGTTLAYFRGFFGNKVTVFHSAMTERERIESWNGLREGRYRIVIGPRSAIFAPLQNIGLIIVDEEHDPSYKQDEPSPRFHGRDTAIMRAKLNNIPILLGSASPSIESYYNATQGRYELLKLNERPAGAELPNVQIIDMKNDRLGGDARFLSYNLKKNIEKCINDDKQLILFLNRRGFAPQLKCVDCGHVPECPHCHVTLTYHKVGAKMVCHYCGYLQVDEFQCEKCNSSDFYFIGSGTQRIEEQLPKLFEKASPVRFDSDSASGRKNSQKILQDFKVQKYNMLLGTQMVTKGLDLAGVSLVGVLSADQGLDIPDFRASEKSFARLLQVAGRSGRRSQKGEVIIQTFYPESDVIKNAANQDYENFYKQEIESRKLLNFPPFCRLISFVLSGSSEYGVEKASLQFKAELKKMLDHSKIENNILGPAPCPLYYLRKRFRRRILLKVKSAVKVVRLLAEWEENVARYGLPASVKLIIDVDPDDMM